MYKFIHTGFPKYFAPHLSTYRTTYNTRRSQSVANFLNAPKFQPTIHKSTKQFGFSFAFDAPTLWNSLPEDIRASPTIASFRKKLKTYLYAKAYPTWLIFSYGFSVVLTYFCHWTLNLHIAIVLLCLRGHYLVKIKRYKSRIRIRKFKFETRKNMLLKTLSPTGHEHEPVNKFYCTKSDIHCHFQQSTLIDLI